MHEAHLSTPNTIESSPDTVQEAFYGAEERIYGITEQPEFAEACLQQGLDPIKSVNTQPYWGLVADFALRDIASREGHENALEDATLELLALTPAYLYAEKALKSFNFHPSERQGMRQQVSYYNGLLRYLGSNFEDVRASDVLQATMNVADIAQLSEPATDNQLRHAVRGAQHELAFGQILSHAGFTFEPAPVEQDLRGVDYTVDVAGKAVLVDVKASLSEIEALGEDKAPYAIKRPQRANDRPVVVIYSMIQDSEFHDSFAISDEIANSRASILKELLTKARKRAA